jgi:hypothetical protein
MGISDGEPQPMMAMNVGVGSCRSDSGVIELLSVRRYS